MNTLIVILCVFLVLEVVAYSYLLFKIKWRFTQVMRYSEYTTLALLEYSLVIELMDQYIVLKQKGIDPDLERAVLLDIQTHHAKAKENLKIALHHYNPDKHDLDNLVKPYTLFQEKS